MKLSETHDVIFPENHFIISKKNIFQIKSIRLQNGDIKLVAKSQWLFCIWSTLLYMHFYITRFARTYFELCFPIPVCIVSCSVSSFLHYGDNKWGRWRLKSPASRFTQPFVQDQRKHQSSESLAFVWGIHRSQVSGELPVQRTINAENISILWRHHGNGLKRVATLRYGVVKSTYSFRQINQPRAPIVPMIL